MSAEEAAALTRGTDGAVALRARWAAALVFLGVAGVLVGGLAYRYVARERYVYFWDSANYWLWFIEFSPALQTAPRAAVGQLISSVRHSDYNLLPILPLATFSWFFGTS